MTPRLQLPPNDTFSMLTRENLLKGAILVSCWLVWTTEILSLLRAFSYWPVLALWFLSVAGVGAWVFLKARPVLMDFKVNAQSLLREAGRLEWIEAVSLGAIIVLVVIAFFSGLLSPPNNWDSMFVHMPRQVRWIQNQTLAPYPSHVIEQISREPFVDILSAHLLMLTDTDRFCFLVQWVGLIACLVAASLIAREVGCDRKGQILAALLTITVPVAFLQGSNTKNDLVMGLWVCTLTWMSLRLVNRREWNWKWTALVGLNLGLLVLTKGTAYFMPVPVYLLVADRLLRRYRWRTWKHGLAILFLALSLLSGMYWRNWLAFGQIINPDRGIYRNELFTPGAIASRLLTEMGEHVATPVEAVNRWSYAAIAKAHRWLGVQMDDPRLTWPGILFFIAYTPGDEGMAQATFHLVLGLCLPAFLLLFWKPLRSERAFWFLLGLPYAFFVILAVLLKWNFTGGARYHIPIFILIGVLWARLATVSALRRLTPVLAAAALLWLIPSVWTNPRSLVPPGIHRPEVELMFAMEPTFKDSYLAAAGYIHELDPAVVGLDSRGAWTWEYPMMRLLMGGFGPRPRFVSFNVPNQTAKLPYRYSPPDVVVSLSPQDSMADAVTGQKYRACQTFGFISVLVPERTACPRAGS